MEKEMTREERLEKIEADCKYTTERTSNLHFLLSEVKRLEAENASLLKDEGLACERGNRLAQQCDTLQKENAELREGENALLFESEYQCKSIANLQSKLEKAVKALEQIVRGDPTEHCVRQWYSVATHALAELKEGK